MNAVLLCAQFTYVLLSMFPCVVSQSTFHKVSVFLCRLSHLFHSFSSFETLVASDSCGLFVTDTATIKEIHTTPQHISLLIAAIPITVDRNGNYLDCLSAFDAIVQPDVSLRIHCFRKQAEVLAGWHT